MLFKLYIVYFINYENKLPFKPNILPLSYVRAYWVCLHMWAYKHKHIYTEHDLGNNFIRENRGSEPKYGRELKTTSQNIVHIHGMTAIILNFSSHLS